LIMDFSKWLIIVVEDTFDDSQLIAKVLEHSGISVQRARNGNECLEMVSQCEPTAVVTDLAMPERDGWQTLVALRSNSRTAHIPVIALTAYHSADVAEDASQAGFDGYFPKPINPQTFVKLLTQIVTV